MPTLVPMVTSLAPVRAYYYISLCVYCGDSIIFQTALSMDECSSLDRTSTMAATTGTYYYILSYHTHTEYVTLITILAPQSLQ